MVLIIIFRFANDLLESTFGSFATPSAEEDATKTPTFKAEIKKLQAEIAEAETKGYNKGYSDGTVDGVREGLNTTKDDRRMMAQIAAIAAAVSFVP